MDPQAQQSPAPPPRARWLGATVAVAAVALWGAVSWWAAPGLRTPDPQLAHGAEASLIAAPRDDHALDESQLTLAQEQVRDLHAAFGHEELARQARACFRRLEREPSGRLLDYCVALDTYSLAIHRGLGPAARRQDADWYADARSRHRMAAETVLMGRGDADARMGELYRLVQIDVSPPRPVPKKVQTASPKIKARRNATSTRVYAEQNPAPRRTRAWNAGMSKSF